MSYYNYYIHKERAFIFHSLDSTKLTEHLALLVFFLFPGAGGTILEQFKYLTIFTWLGEVRSSFPLA